MYSLLVRLFIKDYKNTGDANVRRAYGELAGILGVGLNIMLFLGKYIAGFLSGSIAIMADAFNNLSDAGSSVITLIGFRYSGKKADMEHPFGHGRVEYISGFIVSMAIILVGIELLKSSFGKIFNPTPVEESTLVFGVLAVSILVKLYMCFYNRKAAGQIDSSTMNATAMDSFSDSIATSVVLISMLTEKYTGFQIDGYCGLLVALFIIYAGYNAAKDTISPLLGKMPSEEYVKQIEEIVMAHDEIIGMHDLVVHDYGAGRVLISLHGEVSGNENIFVLHDAIDRIEHELNEKLGCEAVIHMDPIVENDIFVDELKSTINNNIKALGFNITMHDFRVVKGTTHTNIIFDIVIPYDLKISDSEIKEKVEDIVMKTGENHIPVIKIDKAYTKLK